MDIFGARESQDRAISLKELVAGMHHPDARHISPRPAVVPTLLEEVGPGSVVLILSAGDGDSISTEYLLGMRERRQDHV
jgi:UDP-N-acetylmuramate-alanine ligase